MDQTENHVGEGATKTPVLNHFVVVLPFSENRQQILLLKKNKPDYLRGKWNGPGGRVELEKDGGDEFRIFRAARREMLEEVGVDIFSETQEHIINMMFFPSVQAKRDKQPLHIDFIAVYTDKIFKYTQMEEEYPLVHSMDSIFPFCHIYPLVSNLYWMIPFAVDRFRSAMISCEEVQR